MSRFFDQAAMVEELQRKIALENQAAKTADVAAVSAYECEECGEPIPEARRQAVRGCRCCLTCQEEIERYGKTRFTACRD